MTVWEYWQLSMYYIYGSMVGMCNVIFTVAVISLIVARWDVAGDFMKGLMVIGCCLFTVVQPGLLYQKARKQAAANTEETWLGFDEQGIRVRVGRESSLVRWKQIRRISKKPTMLVIFSDASHGFVLTNRVLGEERKDFYQYLRSRMGTGK